jgi:hypothetical protein
MRSQRFRIQFASDVSERDGLGAKLIAEDGSIVAEVFRSDDHLTVVVKMFGNELPLDAMEQFLSLARQRLDPFVTGEPLDSALNFGSTVERFR